MICHEDEMDRQGSDEMAIDWPELGDLDSVKACVVDGLNYSCSSRHCILRYLGSTTGNEGITRLNALEGWYIPLLRKGYTVPFFLMYDLGLLFVYGERYTRNRRFSGAEVDLYRSYVQVSERIQNLVSGLLGAVERETRRDRRRWELREELRFSAASVFLERFLLPFDSCISWLTVDPMCIAEFSLDDLLLPQFKKNLKRGTDVLGSEKGALLREARSKIEERIAKKAKHGIKNPNAWYLRRFVEEFDLWSKNNRY